MADTEEDFAIIRPTLIRQLRSILDLYPDDGQILKELIQNAEDARASEVKFLVDEHTYGTDRSSFTHPELVQFQGPALYAYNNALFEEKDWLGIRMLQDSVKEKDPMKVGRFGLGFKSVLHLTDLPCVMSGDRLAMIDPHEKYFTFKGSKTTGFSWHLQKHQRDIQILKHQFQPFVGIFGSTEKTFKQGKFSGTLFRFPLRTQPSPLSETVYTAHKVKELLTSFCADAHIVLLFLNHVECVEVYTRLRTVRDPKLMFKVYLGGSLPQVRKARQNFAKSIELGPQQNEPIAITYPVTIETFDTKVSTKQNWLVCSYFAGKNVSIQLRQLVSDPVMNYFPLVGVAMPLGKKPENEDEEKSKDVANTGHVFCFLPLPIEQKSATGLPVNINGFFAVDQNRRHLKWPVAGQKSGDKSILWNQCLLSEVIPHAYLKLILSAVDLQTKYPSYVTVEDIYSAIPAHNQVNEKWERLLAPFYTQLFQNAVINTKNGGKWKNIADVVLDYVVEDEQIRSVLSECLLECGTNVASIPSHLIEALYNAGILELNTIQPVLVSACYKHAAKQTSYSRDDKLLILKYLLQNGKVRDLIELDLLPLADGNFCAFSQGHVQKRYLDSSIHPRSILPHLESRFVDDTIDTVIIEKLNEIASQGSTQLTLLDENEVTTLLPKCLPENWIGSRRVLWNTEDKTHPPAKWIPNVWKYLQQHFPEDLRKFEGIPLIPYSSHGTNCLMSLASPTVLILKEYCNFELPENICDLLSLAGIYVIRSLPVEVLAHPSVLGRYVVLPLPEDLLDALVVAISEKDEETVLDAVNTWPDDCKRNLRTFLSNVASSTLVCEQISLLKKLPIFETVDGSGNSPSHFVSAREVFVGTDGQCVPAQLSHNIIDISMPDSGSLAKVIKVPILSCTMLLKSWVFPDIHKGFYDADKLHTLMLHVLNHLPLYMEEDKTFSVASLPFIPTSTGHITSPSELFDPEVDILQKLFYGQDVFPSDAYKETSTISILRRNGLKGTNDITAVDILSVAGMLSQTVISVDNFDDIQEKSLSLLQILNKYPHHLSVKVEGKSVASHLHGLNWLMCEKQKPAEYPGNLHWYENSECLFCPSDMVARSMAKLAASVKPVLPCAVTEPVAVAFGWKCIPDVNEIVKHMKNITESYISADKANYVSMLAYIYERLAEADMGELSDALRDINLCEWIWQGEGFTYPEQVVLKNPFMDLRPYLFTLPTEVRKHETFFLKFGIRPFCDERMLIRVLFLIKMKYDKPESLFDKEEVVRDLQLSVDILNYLKPADGDILSDEIRETLLVATRTNSNEKVKMLPLSECTYCDELWLKQGYDLMDFTEEDGIVFIHPLIPTSTAKGLGVPTLMSRMLKAEELNITGFGQTEPLTTRLHQLTEEYTDGMAIPKELIQNADDAGATEVIFLYDERENADHLRYLIDDGMRECQGPALWVYNDAEFSDLDFENITKLGGATKDSDTSKIGRFGLGFNAVYNITDVPSFISRDNIVIFDPHTTHLGKAIRDKPGIKIDMKKNKTLLRKLPDQFHPYNNVLGCKVSADSDSYYSGTLFRLPLRTNAQAAKSKISNKSYNRSDMHELLRMLIRNLNTLLLFSQNVLSVSIYHLSADGNDPNEASLLFKLKKSQIRIVRELSVDVGLSESCNKLQQEDQTLVKNCSILKAASKVMGQMKNTKKISTGMKQIVSKHVSSSVLIEVKYEITESGSTILKINEGQSESYWLVSSEMGTGKSLDLALQHKEYIPTASVALRLIKQNGGFVPFSINQGRVYCYMPLPIQSQLPVHVNGHFAVTSNRRGLVERTEDDKHSFKVEWNDSLLRDSVCTAYCKALKDVVSLVPEDLDVYFYLLWPDIKQVVRSVKKLAYHVYERILSDDTTAVLYTAGSITDLKHLVLLDPVLNEAPGIASLAMNVFQKYSVVSSMIELPSSLMESIKATPSAHIIESKIYHRLGLFEEIIFPNLKDLESYTRDPLILYALSDETMMYDDLLKHHDCIPVSPDGCVLQKPMNLVSPFETAARLYDETDGRFPHGKETYLSRKIMTSLARLGMAVNDISWEDLMERASSISAFMQQDKMFGQKRLAALLEIMDTKILDFGLPDENTQNVLITTEFLPVLRKPETFPLEWKGDEYGTGLLSASDLYLKRHKHLIGSQQPLLDDRFYQNKDILSMALVQFFRFNNKEVPLKDVISQLKQMAQVDIRKLDRQQYTELHTMSMFIYAHLQQEVLENKVAMEVLQNEIKDCPWILIKGTFIDSSQVALRMPDTCEPHLYGMPEEMRRQFTPLMKIGGVRDQFEMGDYVKALQSVKEESQQKPLSGRRLDTALKLTKHLNTSMKEAQVSQSLVEEKCGTIFIPNVNGVMQASSELCYNDCPWLSTSNQVSFTHPDMTYEVALQLGASTKRQQALSKHSTALPFGQKEKLTNTLKRILNTYPCDHEIFKELLQNADDAKASEIHFILDTRHHNSEHIFSKSWKPLQGPALCVYNDQPFTLVDLEGIQNLGEGSKSCDPNKTGQYGIGFSSVYHLTDVPSLITESDELGETLCVFDPHCKYVPGATQNEPGMRYNNLDQLKDDFPDVFPCYLQDNYKMSNSTLFRFPLRSALMAQSSSISRRVITVDDVKRVMEKFRNEAVELLLFVNNVKKIVFREIGVDGKMRDIYTIVSEKLKEDQEQCSQFHDYVKKITKGIKSQEMTLSDIVEVTASYQLVLKDTAGLVQRWNVMQSIGGDSEIILPESVRKAFQSGELALLPRGGVACLLESWKNGYVEKQEKPKKAFCFLPLPLETGLPFHVNGHFALGYENRRQLWTDQDGSGFKDDWNQYLFSAVIAPCYVKVLLNLRNVCLKSATQDNTNYLSCSRVDLEQALQTYNNNFPAFSELRPYWNNLVSDVYRRIASDEVRVLPVVQGFSAGSQLNNLETETTHWKINWHPPGVDGNYPTYFNNLEKKEPVSQSDNLFMNVLKGFRKGFLRKQEPKVERSDSDILKDVLLECGFNLVESSQSLFDSFIQAGVQVEYVSPEAVLAFFKSSQLANSPCMLGTVPKELQETPFKDIRTLTILLKYCKTDPNFIGRLSGLPLLLTQDEVLRTYDILSPVFLTPYNELLYDCSDVFVHKSLADSIFADITSVDYPVFQEFNIESLANLLDRKLSAQTYRDVQSHVEWKKFDKNPSETWLRSLWIFLTRECLKSNPNISQEDMREMTSQKAISKLQPLNNWAILPARNAHKHFLVPLKMSSSVVDLTNCSYEQYAVRDVLRKFQIPELDRMTLFSSDVNISEFASMLTTTLSKTDTMLTILHQTVTKSSNNIKLTRDESDRLLLYFNQNIDKLRSDPKNVELLRELPIFTTVYGDVISLSECLVYTLPSKIPTDEMDIWQNRTGTVFLRRNENIRSLYELLGCAMISVVEVYCQFILQHFEYLSPNARYVHLYHLYKTYLTQSNSSELTPEEKDGLLDMLKVLEFLPGKDGSLLTADSFYDPSKEIFQIMLSEDKFPPKPGQLFKESEWIDFLGMLGLVRTVSNDLCIQFAKQISFQAAEPQNIHAMVKSKVLVKHLFENPGQVELLDEISDIQFVAPMKASDNLRTLHPQYGVVGNQNMPYFSFRNSVSRDYEEIVWTKANILPDWADPKKCQSLDIATRNQLMESLNIQKEPTVELVLLHLLELCSSMDTCDNPSAHTVKYRMEVFKAVYRYLQVNGIESNVLKERLQYAPCIIVENGKKLVKPNQTVFNLFEGDQIQPYLYKVPVELGEFQQLFLYIGSTDTTSANQYAEVLEMIRFAVNDDTLMPNELLDAYKAVKGLLTAIEVNQNNEISTTLYLPSEKGQLMESSNLVFNDAPSYYDRTQSFKRPFLVDLKECDVRAVHFEDILNKLPSKHRPQILSSLIKETLVDSCRSTIDMIGMAAELKRKLTSEEFSQAAIRLIRHEHHRTGKKMHDVMTDMFDAIDNLQTIRVYRVKNLTTHLICEGKHIKDSEMQKSCFMEKTDCGTRYVWNIYVTNDATMSQDLLIKLAEIVNEILKGLLGHSVLYLLPILACETSEVSTRLNVLNIREDHSQPASRAPSLPTPGSPIPVDKHRFLKSGHENYHKGEYVGYKSVQSEESWGEKCVYARVMDKVYSASGSARYLITIGKGCTPFTVDASELFRFSRN